MGIGGLTTYVQHPQRQDHYFRPFKLHDCNLIIDAPTLCKLTNVDAFKFKKLGSSAFAACCYGGDYDKYDKVFEEFMNALKQCNIKPYFIYDGAKSRDSGVKTERAVSRVQNTRLISPDLIRFRQEAIKKNNRNKKSGLLYPIGLKYTFQDAMLDQGLNVATICNNDSIYGIEADNVTAQVAKQMNCPVLALDSDFFIFGAMYIPITSVNFTPVEDFTNWRKPFKYLSCKVFDRKILENNLPYCLPILIGNDTLSQTVINVFLERKGITGNEYQRITKIFQWLQTQSSAEDVIVEILASFDSVEEKTSILKKIEGVVNEYVPAAVQPVLDYFQLSPETHVIEEISVDFVSIRQTVNIAEAPEAEVVVPHNQDVSANFRENIISCRYPRYFSKMLNNKYSLPIYIDDITKCDSNTISFKLLAATHQILVQDVKKKLELCGRDTNHAVLKYYNCPPWGGPLPTVEQLQHLNLGERKKLLLSILDFDEEFGSKICSVLPEKWHLFVLAIRYCQLHTNFSDTFVYVVVLLFLILNYVDPKLDKFYRTSKEFYAAFHRPFQSHPPSVTTTENRQIFSEMAETDLINLMGRVIKFFEIQKDDTEDTFDRSIMHTLCEFHSLFFHLKHLNDLLNTPVMRVRMSKVFNGTFLYNMYKSCLREAKTKEYFSEYIFSRSPTVLQAFTIVCELLEC